MYTIYTMLSIFIHSILIQYTTPTIYICLSYIQLLVCGQALSHCVNFTFSDLLDEWPADKRARLVLLTDGRCIYSMYTPYIDAFDYAYTMHVLYMCMHMLQHTLYYTCHVYVMYIACSSILYLYKTYSSRHIYILY